MIDLLIFLAGWVLLAGWFWLDTKPWKKLPGLFSYLVGGRRGHRSV